MTSIRLRLLLLMALFAAGVSALAWASYASFNKIRDWHRQIESSYSLHDDLQDLNNFKANAEQVSHWRQRAAGLLPRRRGEELSHLLDDLAGGVSEAELRERHRVLLKNEAEFQRFARERMDYQEKCVVYFAGLGILLLAMGFLSLLLFVRRSIIHPMRDLARKMDDFLHDRYTYQFSVPSQDEIGQMQSTFNKLAQRVISNMEQLKTLDQAKSEFLSIASHELRTPLTSIKGSLSLMRSGVVGSMNEMADNLLRIAESETDRLIRLINDVLDLAKIEARQMPLHQDWHCLEQLTHKALQSLQGLARQADVHLVADPLPTVDVYMDEDRIQQVLTNLLSNAIKFSPAGKTVCLRAEIHTQGALVIEVRDQGRGIAPQDQEAIFQKFRQATNSRNPLVKGTGLGLAIARALVEQHGGEIGVRSAPGEGSTFFFTLPEWRPGVRRVQNEKEVAA